MISTSQLARILAIAAVGSLQACGSDSRAQVPQAEVPPDPIVTEICPGACARVLQCVQGSGASFDLLACNAQCAKEVTGSGYLTPYVAQPVFRRIRDNASGGCPYIFSQTILQDVPSEVPLKEPAVLDECRQAMSKLSMSPPNSHTLYCYAEYYVFNTSLRNEIRPCFSAGTRVVDIMNCMDSKQPPDYPWIAGAQPPSDPLRP